MASVSDCIIFSAVVHFIDCGVVSLREEQSKVLQCNGIVLKKF